MKFTTNFQNILERVVSFDSIKFDFKKQGILLGVIFLRKMFLR
jgi:hypothetical protein